MQKDNSFFDKVDVVGTFFVLGYCEKFHLTPQGGRYDSAYWIEIPNKMLGFMKSFLYGDMKVESSIEADQILTLQSDQQ